MSTSLTDTLCEFEDQLRHEANAKLSNQPVEKKTRIEEDGTVMEWNEEKRAWFPKLDDAFMASYQMNFGMQQTLPSNIPTNENAVHQAWAAYAANIEQVKLEKGENNPEIQEELQSAEAALLEYYNSPAYRVWYEEYQKNCQTESQKVFPLRKKQASTLLPLSADDALDRAQEEQDMGIPIVDNKALSRDDGSGLPTEDNQPRKRKKNKGPPEWYEVADDKNTHVYVSGLPPTINESSFTELMSKYGIIMNDPLTEKLRIKLYKNSAGQYKGDGVCCYIKIESVDLALQILDGMIYEEGYTLHVERAKFQPKEDFDHNKHRRLTAKEKRKFKKQQENLFKWRMDPSKLVRGKKERVITLRNVFDETDLCLDVSLIPVIRERIRVQCAKVGVVKRIVVYDTNPQGIVCVTFSCPEEADIAINFLDKALFTYPVPNQSEVEDDGRPLQRSRQLSVARWDGKERFDKNEAADEEQIRLSRWNKFLSHDGSDSDSDCVDDVKVEVELDGEQKHALNGVESIEKTVVFEQKDKLLVDKEIDLADESQEDEVAIVDTDEELSPGGHCSGAETE